MGKENIYIYFYLELHIAFVLEGLYWEDEKAASFRPPIWAGFRGVLVRKEVAFAFKVLKFIIEKRSWVRVEFFNFSTVEVLVK